MITTYIPLCDLWIISLSQFSTVVEMIISLFVAIIMSVVFSNRHYVVHVQLQCNYTTLTDIVFVVVVVYLFTTLPCHVQ